MAKASTLFVGGAFALVASAFSTSAQTDDPSTAASIPVEDIISIATGDFNGDDDPDAAMLVMAWGEDTHGSTLHIFLEGHGDDTPPGKLGEALRVEDAAWPSDQTMYGGQVPQLVALGNGSLQIISMNFAIGRDAWEQKITLAYRDERFLVAGFTYNSRDKLQEYEPVDCDLNLFSGRGVLNDERVTFEASRIPFEEWIMDEVVALCEPA